MKKTEIRKEYKFIENEDSKADHLSHIRNNYKKLHPSRNIQSLYLDTINLKIYNDSLSNDVDKFKIRFRKYEKNKEIRNSYPYTNNKNRQ